MARKGLINVIRALQAQINYNATCDSRGPSLYSVEHTHILVVVKLYCIMFMSVAYTSRYHEIRTQPYWKKNYVAFITRQALNNIAGVYFNIMD